MESMFRSFFNQDKKNRPTAEIIFNNEKPANEERIKIKAKVFGLVQGVGFRYTTVHLAKQLGIDGIVRNESDGSVYVEAAGSDEKIDAFIQELAKGPSPSAQVEKVVITYDSSIKDYTGFGERH